MRTTDIYRLKTTRINWLKKYDNSFELDACNGYYAIITPDPVRGYNYKVYATKGLDNTHQELGFGHFTNLQKAKKEVRAYCKAEGKPNPYYVENY